MSFLLGMVSGYIYMYMLFVSARLVEAENLDWCLLRVSDERLIKWLKKSWPIFKLSLHLNWAIATSQSASTIYTYNSLLSFCFHESCISYLCSIENPPNVHMGNFRRHWKWPLLIAYLWGLQSWKGRKCYFRDNGELIRC